MTGLGTNVLVVGCGSIGTRHVGNLTSFQSVDVSVHDARPERASSTAEQYGVEAVTGLEEGLDRGPDAVLVCTPPSTHLDLAEEALAAGADVFVEKPLSDDGEGVDAFLDRVRETSATVMVGCNMRFHPPVVRIQEWLDEGAIGEVRFGRLRYGNDLRNWREGDYEDSYSARDEGGVILDAIHELDLAEHWLGDVSIVNCESGTLSDMSLAAEDTAEILLRGLNGALAEVHLDYIRPQRARTYELVGTGGMLRWEAVGKSPEYSTVSLFRRAEDSWQTYNVVSDLNEMYVEEMRHFVACTQGEERPIVDADRGAEILDLALAAKRSADRGERIKLGRT